MCTTEKETNETKQETIQLDHNLLINLYEYGVSIEDISRFMDIDKELLKRYLEKYYKMMSLVSIAVLALSVSKYSHKLN